MKIFSKTVNYACRYVLRLRDQSGGREVARVFKAGVGQGAESKKGSALNLRNLFFKKLSFLLCNVTTLSGKNEILALYIATLGTNVSTLETHI